MAQQQQTEKKHEHVHPQGQTYLQTCKACRAEDRARSRADFQAIKDADLERTTFLVPDTAHDGKVCREYIARKYPDAEWIGSSIDLSRLSGWGEGEQLVVVRIDAWPRTPTPGQMRKKDAEDKWETVETPLDQLVPEVVEMAPIDVRKCIVVSKADRFTKQATNLTPLVQRLEELMPPPYRVDMPRDPEDTLLRFAIT